MTWTDPARSCKAALLAKTPLGARTPLLAKAAES